MRMGGSNGGSDSCPDRHSGDRKDGICDSLNNKQHTYLRGRSGIRCFDSLIWLFGYGYGFDFNLCKIWSRLNHDAGVICDSLNLLADQVPQRLQCHAIPMLDTGVAPPECRCPHLVVRLRLRLQPVQNLVKITPRLSKVHNHVRGPRLHLCW